MRKHKSIFVIFLTIISFATINGQISEQSAKNVANQLFKSCEKNNHKSAADILAYHGSDETRLYKDTYKYSDSKEASNVKRFCNRLKAMIEISDSYELGKLRSRKIYGKEFQSLDVIFKSGNQKIKNKLVFIDIKGNAVVYKLE